MAVADLPAGAAVAVAGAVVGGLVIGVLLNLLGAYVHFVTAELRLPVALAVLLGVLLVRPAGLFGRAAVRRV
jgi:branched-chain amino acid transport system permease protein